MTVSLDSALGVHLRSWIGAWPPSGTTIDVVATSDRLATGWDGRARPLLGAVRPEGGAVVTTEPRIHRPVADLLHGREVAALQDPQLRAAVGRIAGGAGAVLGVGVLRAVTEVSSQIEPLGTWLEVDDPRIPTWLRPFGGPALVMLDEDGTYAAGVGVKRHDRYGHELSVVTEPAHRGRGWARRLVATAARRVLRHVPVVTYLHAEDNEASARVADAVGFPDRGWRALGVFGGERGE